MPKAFGQLRGEDLERETEAQVLRGRHHFPIDGLLGELCEGDLQRHFLIVSPHGDFFRRPHGSRCDAAPEFVAVLD